MWYVVDFSGYCQLLCPPAPLIANLGDFSQTKFSSWALYDYPLVNIAMENDPFVDGLPIKIVIFHGYVSHNQMVYGDMTTLWSFHHSYGKSPCLMDRSSNWKWTMASIAVWNRWYIKWIGLQSHKIPLHPIKSPIKCKIISWDTLRFLQDTLINVSCH